MEKRANPCFYAVILAFPTETSYGYSAVLASTFQAALPPGTRLIGPVRTTTHLTPECVYRDFEAGPQPLRPWPILLTGCLAIKSLEKKTGN